MWVWEEWNAFKFRGFFLCVFQYRRTHLLTWRRCWTGRRCWWCGRCLQESWMGNCRASWWSTAHLLHSRSVWDTQHDTHRWKENPQSASYWLFTSLLYDSLLWIPDWTPSCRSICPSRCPTCPTECVPTPGPDKDPGPRHRLWPSSLQVSEITPCIHTDTWRITTIRHLGFLIWSVWFKD